MTLVRAGLVNHGQRSLDLVVIWLLLAYSQAHEKERSDDLLKTSL